MRLKIAEHNTIEELEKEIKSRQPDRYRLRLQAILLAKQGMNNKEVQKALLISRHAKYLLHAHIVFTPKYSTPKVKTTL